MPATFSIRRADVRLRAGERLRPAVAVDSNPNRVMTFHLAYAATVVNWFTGWKFTGHFTTVDLIAASTNALNGALLARRPDHFKNFTVVGVMGMALLMGLGGGITRDVLVNQTPGH